MNVDTASLPFLTACFAALMDDKDEVAAEQGTLYWIHMMERMSPKSEQKPTPLEEEVVRLRILLHNAREEAEKWKNVVENGLS